MECSLNFECDTKNLFSDLEKLYSSDPRILYSYCDYNCIEKSIKRLLCRNRFYGSADLGIFSYFTELEIIKCSLKIENKLFCIENNNLFEKKFRANALYFADTLSFKIIKLLEEEYKIDSFKDYRCKIFISFNAYFYEGNSSEEEYSNSEESD